MTTPKKPIYDSTAGTGRRGQKDETPTTVATVAGAKPNKTEAILKHAWYALNAILLLAQPFVFIMLAMIAWEVLR